MAIAPTRTRPSEDELALARDLIAIGPHFGKLAWHAAADCGVGSAERSRLLMLLAQGPQRSGHLAQQLRLAPATVSELVEGLVVDGLVSRDVDPDDRRAVSLALTAEGRRQRQQFEQAAATRLARVVGRLTPAQQRRVRAAFADIRAAFIAASQDEESLRPTITRERSHVR